MQLVDIGANLTAEAFKKDLDNVIERGFNAGVGTMILTGSDEQDSQQAAALAARHPKQFWSTVGIHPHMAANFGPSSADNLRNFAQNDCVVAIGESGLDYNRDYSPRDKQRQSFEAHIELAGELSLPLFLHQRDAHDDFMKIVNEQNQKISKAVVHCFTGSESELDDYLAMGFYIGITGWICDERRGHHLREFIGKIPSDRLMIETDAPYLLPRDIRPKPKSRRNEPMYLPHICDVIAAVRDVSSEQLALETTATAKEFFNLPA